MTVSFMYFNKKLTVYELEWLLHKKEDDSLIIYIYIYIIYIYNILYI